MLINMINLPNFKILDMKESAHDYRFLVESTTLPPSHCLKCGTVANLYKHGKKQQLFFDLPMHAKRVGIYVNRQRYKCRECNETFFENLPDMDVNRSVSNRLINWIQEASLEKTFTSVAEEIGVDEKTVRNIFNDFDDQIKLQIWTDMFPLLGQAYELKEQFFDIYEAESINEAYKLYQNWFSNVPKELMAYFEGLIKAMNNWEEEIFNYFNSPITNAYTESLNRLIKTMNHIGRGYSFETLRAKILFTQGYRKLKKKKKFKEVEVTFGKMLPDYFPNWEQTGYEWVYEEIYGADFSTLTKSMEEGTF